MSAALIEPDLDLIEQLRIRSVDWSLRKGAMFTFIEPERVFRCILAGTFAVEVDWGTIVISIEPESVSMESRS